MNKDTVIVRVGWGVCVCGGGDRGEQGHGHCQGGVCVRVCVCVCVGGGVTGGLFTCG